VKTEHYANRTHQVYALGYYHGRTRGMEGVPDLSRTVDLIEDFYRLGYAHGLKDQWAEEGEQGLTTRL
jgi:hypothetical protein